MKSKKKIIKSADVQISALNQVNSKKKVIKSADVQISTLNQVNSEKKVITSADVQISTLNQVNSKKKVIKSADVQISAQNQVNNKKKGHHVRRCPNFRPKSSEQQKKGHRCPNRDPQVEDLWLMTYCELLCSKTSNYPPETLIFPSSG